MKVSLDTKRLLLRPFHMDDHAAYAAINSDPEVMRYVQEGRPLTDGESFRVLSMIVGHWELRGYGIWALEDKENGALVGHAGFWYPTDWPGVELCFRLDRAYWGRGLATEGARRAQQFGFDQLAFPSIVSIIHRQNIASIGVAGKLGMTPQGTFHAGGFHAALYQRTRAE